MAEERIRFNVDEVTDEQLQGLAQRLAPFMPVNPTGAAPVEVVVDRMHRLTGGAVLAYVDLMFRVNGLDLCLVKGFRFIAKGDGSRWLAVPERKSDTPNADGSDKYLVNFAWGNNNVKDQARRVVKEHYDQIPAPAPTA